MWRKRGGQRFYRVGGEETGMKVGRTGSDGEGGEAAGYRGWNCSKGVGGLS